MIVQENNFLEMPEFDALGKRFNVDTVYSQQIVSWDTFSEEELARRAIHLPGHLRYQEFVDLLQGKTFSNLVCYLGNLLGVREAPFNPISSGQET